MRCGAVISKALRLSIGRPHQSTCTTSGARPRQEKRRPGGGILSPISILIGNPIWNLTSNLIYAASIAAA